jgi:endo-1,4-beta-xylanase
MANEGKRNAVVMLIKNLQTKGIRIDAIGMQGHLNMNFPPVEEFEKSLLAFSGQGVKVMITELDLGILPDPDTKAGADIALNFEYQQSLNPYTGGLPEKVETDWTERYYAFFKLFLKHSDKISRVTLWGVSDCDSWRNNWPVAGRTDYPLLFDRNYQAKTIVQLIINEAQ